MKKILIISFRFPPNTETGANRPLGWAKFLHQFGYKPVILTRNWDRVAQTDTDALITPSGNKIIHQVYETHEVYYLPYSGNFRTRFFLRHPPGKYTAVKKVLSFFDQVTEAWGWYRFSEYRSFFSWTQKFLKQHPEVEKCIITASPFKLFNIGKIVKHKYGLRWIADYRDPWNTAEVHFRSYSLLHRIIKALEKKAERRWCGTANAVTSVSDYLTQKIAAFVHVPGTTIYNGYLPQPEKDKIPPEDSGHKIPAVPAYKIVYNGNLLPFQDIEIFFDGFERVAEEYRGRIDITFWGVGLEYYKQSAQRVAAYTQRYKDHIHMTNRLSYEAYSRIQHNAQLLLIAGSGPSVKGITSSKIFDYILEEKPVLFVHNDKDIVERILLETGQGIFADTAGEVYQKLKSLIEEYILTGKNRVDYNKKSIYFYSREHQTQRLATLLDEI